MNDMSTHARLTRRQRDALALAVVLVLSGMLIGFTSSFVTLYGAAARQGWRYPALLPLAVDSGILAYVLLDHLAITLGARSRWLHLVAAALAAFTVWANAAVAPASSATWRLIHAAMPALWVLGVEALRFTWSRLHEPPRRADPIPPARWVLAFPSTWRMWRRMKLWRITSYSAAVDMELSRLQAMASLADRYGKDWRAKVPGTLAWMLDDGVRMDAALAMVAELTAPPKAAAVPPTSPSARRGNTLRSSSRKPGGTRGEASTEGEAIAILAAEPSISGNELARRLGVSARYGRMLKARLSASAVHETGPLPKVGD